METNEILKEQTFEIISNQIKSNNPPETKLTFERLKGQGYSELEIKKLIGQCIIIEIFNALKHKKPYDEARYIKNLKNLPTKPLNQ